MADLNSSSKNDIGPAIVPVLACVLNQLCLRNDNLSINQDGITKFHALRPPAISIKDYLERVAKYAACSGECFVLALVFIDRIIQSNPKFAVNSLNIHRLVITSIMLAAKFFDDQYFNNAYYAKVGGVPCDEINSLEVEFLWMCNFTLFVTTDTYSQYYTELCNHAANTQNVCPCSRGPKLPALIIPYVNAPGPGQTQQEWQMQMSPNIPTYRNELGQEICAQTELEMKQFILAQQQQQQQQHHQQQSQSSSSSSQTLQPSQRAAAGVYDQQRYGQYAGAPSASSSSASHMKAHSQSQLSQQFAAHQQQQQDQSMH